MLLNRFNESEVDQARALAEECGVLFVPLENFGGFPEEDREKWIATSVQEKYGSIPITMGSLAGEGEMPTECRQLWDSFFINSNGDVFPCCRICKHKWNVGNILEQSFDAIWNGGRMQALRRYVADPDAPAPEFENYCVSCEHRHCRRKSPVKR
jgi:radical SAM protein with 4Fe4S-binding SPASM domain